MTVGAHQEAFPFLITEFEVNGFGSHKDYLVATSEDLSKIGIFVRLVADESISFKELRPSRDNGRIFYAEIVHPRTLTRAGTIISDLVTTDVDRSLPFATRVPILPPTANKLAVRAVPYSQWTEVRDPPLSPS
ncbi:hypothetical protein HDU89_006699 [Geranomyces variabilis]|nr:hypothetical protein HDU89_006699 [Geranomyces variabilis]